MECKCWRHCFQHHLVKIWTSKHRQFRGAEVRTGTIASDSSHVKGRAVPEAQVLLASDSANLQAQQHPTGIRVLLFLGCDSKLNLQQLCLNRFSKQLCFWKCLMVTFFLFIMRACVVFARSTRAARPTRSAHGAVLQAAAAYSAALHCGDLAPAHPRNMRNIHTKSLHTYT